MIKTSVDFNFNSIVSAGKIPDNLGKYDESSRAIFGEYPSGSTVVARYILPGGSGNKNGTSWAHAASNVKTVLEEINDASVSKIYAVLIGPGTYRAGATMAMKNYVTIVGGVSQNNPLAGGETILSGENRYRVFNNNDITNTARLYGVTIAEGKESIGGGMYNNSSSPALTKVVFMGNMGNYGGGGMYNSSSSPVLSGVVFSGNKSDTSGGGMYNNSSSPVLTGVVFSGNTANDYGGGMYNGSSSPVLNNVVFSGNTAYYWGGGMYNDNSSPTVVNSIFWRNSQTGTPGGANVYYSVVEGGTTNNNNITNDPGLQPLTDNGGGIDTLKIPTTSPVVNKGIFVKRSAAATGRDADNNPTYTFYYSIDKTSWYSSPALTGTAVTPPDDAIDLTATDMRGYPVTGRPDIGVYEAR